MIQVFADQRIVDDVLALPGFDEYLLGFKDRALMLAAEHKQAIIPGGNGMFQSTIVRGGRVIGTWKRTATKRRLTVQVRPLVPCSEAPSSPRMPSSGRQRWSCSST